MSCTEDLSGKTRGVVSSPSWPAPYAENANCQYTLSVEAHLQLELHFSDDFDVEESPDGQCIDALRVGVESEYMKPMSISFALRCFVLKLTTLLTRKQRGSSDESAETGDLTVHILSWPCCLHI